MPYINMKTSAKLDTGVTLELKKALKQKADTAPAALSEQRKTNVCASNFAARSLTPITRAIAIASSITKKNNFRVIRKRLLKALMINEIFRLS